MASKREKKNCEKINLLEKRVETLEKALTFIGRLTASASVRSSGLESALLSKAILNKKELDVLYNRFADLLRSPQKEET